MIDQSSVMLLRGLPLEVHSNRINCSYSQSKYLFDYSLGGIILHIFYYEEEKVYGFKQRNCYEAVGCFFWKKYKSG